MADFFTGCTHFGHKNIIKLANRPFDSLEEMNETLIEKWNKTVKPKDTVYHLGDFAWWKEKDRYSNKLNGTLVTIQGNHDPEGWGQDCLTLMRRKVKLVLFHYPIEEWDQWFRASMHLHCHTHKPDLVSAERRFNVGVDATGFKPISLEELFDVYFDKEKR